MCAQFILRTSLTRLLERLGAAVLPSNKDLTLPERVMPFRSGAVLTLKDDSAVLELMQYSLVPSWSKEKRPKYATYNARLDTIESKAAWKKPFARNHCIVPISRFIEPIYCGEYAGNMVQFHDEASEFLLAAGIFDEWRGEPSGEPLRSFALITDEPCDYVREIGHDRQPIFLEDGAAREWLKVNDIPVSQLKEFLRSNAVTPALTCEVDRPMKAGWEKRISQ
ncbi:MAG: SOS response-associated peptidase family protein [Deltaproteobacteria bacterium]|nr:SOS response-associated peptidase family protein [Deltaproteobacteria bacterium]